jgi:hypothetical protein
MTLSNKKWLTQELIQTNKKGENRLENKLKTRLKCYISEEQRKLYRWMLEERRKIKPRDAAEKKKINEEKVF